jgi:hypothetical protein
MPAEFARAIHFKHAKVDAERVKDLASKARAGSPTAEEPSELDDHERTTVLLDLMQSKARLTEKQAGLSP